MAATSKLKLFPEFLVNFVMSHSFCQSHLFEIVGYSKGIWDIELTIIPPATNR